MKLVHSILYITLLLILGAQAVFADANTSSQSTIIYKYFDANGVLHLTNIPPQTRDQVLYARSYLVQSYKTPPPLLPALSQHPKYSDYAPLIEAAALNAGLSPALLHAVVQVESAYNPKARSKKGALGLMQLMPATAKRYKVHDRTDPMANLNGGAHYLRDLLTLFNDDLSLALAAYNAGENAVIRYGNTIPPYRETINYVKKVKQLYEQY
ncbi:MAG: lytic transglycosylase domain-containing protein [Candidatus Parabeggiatoa sp.]|nr:lytic transglycosylase domain-containing protein [Candidatus Parabeggiatoa sp.]